MPSNCVEAHIKIRFDCMVTINFECHIENTQLDSIMKNISASQTTQKELDKAQEKNDLAEKERNNNGNQNDRR